MSVLQRAAQSLCTDKIVKHSAEVVVLALSLYASGLVAAPITFSFTGKVTHSFFEPSLIGAPITGAYTFDSAAVDAIPAPDTGSYISLGPMLGLTANVGGSVYTSSGSLKADVLNALTDQYRITASEFVTLGLFFEDSTGSVFSADALPLTPPPLSSFDFAQFSVLHLGFDLRGTVDTLVCTAGCDGASEPGGRVLEPRSLALLGIGLAVLAISRRRTKA